jgi:energy-coupling factor transport system ATP-binding protein
MAEVATLADTLFVLHEGRLVAQGTPRSIFAETEQLRAWGLAAPPLSTFLSLLRQHGMELPAETFTLEEVFALLKERIFIPHTPS